MSAAKARSRRLVLVFAPWFEDPVCTDDRVGGHCHATLLLWELSRLGWYMIYVICSLFVWYNVPGTPLFPVTH
jgi:hypothetical protein